MEPVSIFWLLYGFFVASSIWDFYLSYRQYKVHLTNEKRPEHVADIISDADYEKARRYKLDRHRFGFVKMTFSVLQTSLVLFCGFLPWLWAASGRWGQNVWSGGGEIWQSIVFIATSSVLETLISLPFNYYDTFIIEQKHGFNKETVPFFFTDRAKKMVVGLLISAPVTAVVIYIIQHGGDWFFVYVWFFITVFVIIMMAVYPEFIAPLFDKYTPLPEGELKQKIEKLAMRVNYPLKMLYVVQGSKRSSHSNAYMYGFWKNKRIVLYDTLLSQELNQELKELAEKAGNKVEDTPPTDADATPKGMKDDEVVAVLGHELGHWDLSHTFWQICILELNMLLLLFTFSFFYRQQALYGAFGFSTQPVIIGLFIVFQFVTAPYNELFSFLSSVLTRQMEFAADRYSAELGQAPLLCSALIKLGRDNLSLPVDDHLFSMVNHSHPPVPERIAAMKKYM